MRIFAWLADQLIRALSNIADLFELLFRPITKGLGEIVRDGEGARGKKPLFVRLLLLVFFPIRLIWLVFTFPLTLFRGFDRSRLIQFGYSIPALLTVVLVLLVTGNAMLRDEATKGAYRRAGNEAILKGDFNKAKPYFGRLVNSSGGTRDQDKLNWSIVLAQTGQFERSKSILDGLAPDDTVGFAPAHRIKALTLLGTLTGRVDVDVLSKIRHHLERADEQKSVQIQNGWAIYYLAIGQAENAIRYMEGAAEINPEYFVTIASIYESNGNTSGKERTLEKAKTIYEKILDKDPLNHSVRILLSAVLVKQNREDQAEQNLKVGVQLQPDQKIMNALSDFYLMRHDRSVYGGKPFEDQLEFLQTALTFDPNHLPVYERLITQSRIHMETEGFEKIQNMLEESIVNGKSTALSHFALGNLMYLKGDFKDSQFHMERAYELDAKFLVIANNLAWLLAHNENPELERAYELIKGVVERRPEDARFRDTLASVLMKLGKTDEALTEFERALPGVQDKKSIHEKLAVLYDQVGKKNLAELHRKKAVEMKGNQ
jgi:tetratricopeptide (TPR) repeat protein